MINNDKYLELTISPNAKISQALQQMDAINRKLLIVSEYDKFIGILSIGDIQRAIIKGIDLAVSIQGILRDNISIAKVGDSLEDIKDRMLAGRSEYMPVISEQNEIARVIFWEDLFGKDKKLRKSQFCLPVLIMAGGVGSRLLPLTNVIPKALIPIGDKSMLEQIIDSFWDYGCRDYYISVNYKADMIKYYMDGIEDRDYNVSYLEEDKFLGTAGSIGLLKDAVDGTFFVSNCDIMVDQDYAEILTYHRDQQNEITVVAALLNISVPYGVLNTDAGGGLISITEKPELFYKINTGLYILEPTVLVDIPNNELFHITDLIQKLMQQGRKVGVFPVSEKSWTDMGNWDEFLKQAKVL